MYILLYYYMTVSYTHLSKTSSLTGLSLAAIVGVILNRILNAKDFKEESVLNLDNTVAEVE